MEIINSHPFYEFAILLVFCCGFRSTWKAFKAAYYCNLYCRGHPYWA